MINYIDDVIMPYIGKQNALLIFDAYGAHYSQDVLKLILQKTHYNLHVAVIPGNYTSSLSLDLCSNKSFKSSYRYIMRESIN